jgi:hypothetical protein
MWRKVLLAALFGAIACDTARGEVGRPTQQQEIDPRECRSTARASIGLRRRCGHLGCQDIAYQGLINPDSGAEVGRKLDT